MNEVKNSISYLSNVWEFTKRNMLVYLKNKTTIIFSLLAPILILVIYTLFMGDLQIDMIRGYLPEGITVSDETIRGVVNSWMISGIVGISCLTVGLNSMLVMISDKEQKTINDFVASPMKPIKLLISYFIAAFILTFVICFIFLLIGILYLWITTGVIFTFKEFLELILILLLSCLSSVIGLMCIMTFFKTISGTSAFTGIFSALIGFLIGAYLPVSILPIGIQNFANLLPGSHSTGLFRTVFMSRMLETLPAQTSTVFLDQIKEMYSFKLQLFGFEFAKPEMYIYLSISIVVLFLLYVVITKIQNKIKHN